MVCRTFTVFNVADGVLWNTGVTAAGYWPGRVTFIRARMEGVLSVIVVLSVLPPAVGYLRSRRSPAHSVAGL
jgi:membrane-associated protein